MKAETPLRTRLVSIALWRGLDRTSLDYFRLQEFSHGYIFNGCLLALFDDYPYQVHYTVFSDHAWVTQRAHVLVLRGEATHQLELRRDEHAQWWRDDKPVPELSGLTDVDISVTPATNTLPIRRLPLELGETRATDAAWIRVPDLAVERLPQQYTRTAEHMYRYESGNGMFNAALEVDEAGVVVRYGDIWERIG